MTYSTTTLASLKAAHAAGGYDALHAILSVRPATELRSTLREVDPRRPGTSRMRRDEMAFLLTEIGSGGNLFSSDDDILPADRIQWGGVVRAEIAPFSQETLDIERELGALLATPAAGEPSRFAASAKLAVFDRVCVLAMRSGQMLDIDDLRRARHLITCGTSDPEAVLKTLRAPACEEVP